MSRIGKQPIVLPAGVTATLAGRVLTITGPKGTLSRVIHPEIAVEVSGTTIVCKPVSEHPKSTALWGLTRALVAGMVEGVHAGFSKKLEIEGIGYRAALEGTTLVLTIGFSHPVRVSPPPGISFSVEKNVIIISGIAKELVGDVAAHVRHLRPPEPYKGKGIRYHGEVVRKKAGKKAVASS